MADDGLTRRGFLTAAGALAATAMVAPRARAQQDDDKTLRLAGIGIGGVGHGQMQALANEGFDVVALCDVDDVYAKKTYDLWPDARKYRDYREMLDREDRRIDAVYIGTPDHTHAIQCLDALGRGKHVCCVKPLTRTVVESRAVAEAAEKAGVATQVTASPNSGEDGCRTSELIWAGAIGDVSEVHIWSNRPLWPQGMQRPDGKDEVPDTLDWDLWIGPAPMRPFVAEWPEGSLVLKQLHNDPPHAVYHPWNFRGWWDFGTGALGDMGCHYFNIPKRALKLGHPTRVHATSTKVLPETAPLSSIVAYDFPEREGMAPTRAIWYDGGLRPPVPVEMGTDQLPGEGVLYVGSEGKMLGSRILSEDRRRKYDDTPQTLERRPGTWGEFMEACRGGQKAACAFDWAAPLGELVLLGNIAIRTGKVLEWDGDEMEFTNDEDANKQLHYEYRDGWSLEA